MESGSTSRRSPLPGPLGSIRRWISGGRSSKPGRSGQGVIEGPDGDRPFAVFAEAVDPGRLFLQVEDPAFGDPGLTIDLDSVD